MHHSHTPIHSTVTTKGQTTIPLDVRQALGLTAGSKIEFTLQNGSAVMRPVGTRVNAKANGAATGGANGRASMGGSLSGFVAKSKRGVPIDVARRKAAESRLSERSAKLMPNKNSAR